MGERTVPHCLREVCLDGGEPASVHQAWTSYPGRVTNDVISKDFQAGWAAGRDWAREQQAREETSRGVTLKLLGCPHTPGCLSVDQCGGRSGR